MALAVGTSVIAGVAALFGALSRSGDLLQSTVNAVDQERSSLRLLRELAFRSGTGGTPAERFRGSATEASFVSWCESAFGWLEPCAVTVRIGARAAGRDGATPESFVGIITRSASFPERAENVAIEIPAWQLRYLVTAREGGVWTSEWVPSVVPPLALAVLTDTDTLLLRVGIRR